MKTGLPTETTLVGREHEINQLIKYLDSAAAGKGTPMLISGEAGVGKTKLANEFLNHAEKREAKTLPKGHMRIALGSSSM